MVSKADAAFAWYNHKNPKQIIAVINFKYFLSILKISRDIINTNNIFSWLNII